MSSKLHSQNSDNLRIYDVKAISTGVKGKHNKYNIKIGSTNDASTKHD